MADPQTVILTSIGVATANNIVANISKDDGNWFRTLLGGFGLSVGLLIVSEFQSEIAKGLAVLVLVASLVGPNGTALANLLFKLSGSSNRLPGQGGGGVSATRQ